MKYDPTLIKTEEIEINGKKIPIQKIPAGMHGPNGGVLPGYEDSYSEEAYEEFTADDPSVYKDYIDFIENGGEPESDEVRAYKAQLELEEIKTTKLLDSLDFEEDFDDFSDEIEFEDEE